MVADWMFECTFRYPVPAETVDPRDQPGIAGKTWTPNTPSSHVERFSEEVFAKDKKGRADPDHAEVAKGKGREVRVKRSESRRKVSFMRSKVSSARIVLRPVLSVSLLYLSHILTLRTFYPTPHR
jgi:hypothetical protein